MRFGAATGTEPLPRFLSCMMPSGLENSPPPPARPMLPKASMSIDLDNKWAYLKSHDDSSWGGLPSYLDRAVPRILKVLDDCQMKISFFIVGQDAVIEENRDSLRMIAEAGHEIANHSFHHEPCLHLYTPDQLEVEFETSEEAIYEATGKRTVGFRGPGFSLSDQVLKTLLRRGYEYDCTMFPTFLGPVARMYYFMSGSFSSQQQKEREALFGKFSDGFAPNRPYNWNIGGNKILEIPVTTFPFLKTPLHATYLQYLARFSYTVAKCYWSAALTAYRTVNCPPSFLLHPLDFIGGDEEPELGFFPAMNVATDVKVERMYKFLDMLKQSYQIVPMAELAAMQKKDQHSVRPIKLVRTGVT